MTIVTDNLPYGESLIRALARTAHEGLLRRSRGEAVVAFVSSPVSGGMAGRTLQEAVSVSAASGPSTADRGKKHAPMKLTQSGVRMRDTDSEDDDDEDDDEDDEDSEHALNDGRTKPSIAATSMSSSSGHSKISADQPVAADALTLELWRGDSEDSGPGGRASSSYFDRLWERGQKKRRWFIVLCKL